MSNTRNRYHYLVVGIILVLTAGAMLFTSQTRADAVYGGCKEAYVAPQSVGADECRDKGWIIGAQGTYVVSPRNVLRYYNLPSCRYEDGSGQRQACGWNVTGGNGNGAGRVYLSVPNGRNQDGSARDDRVIYLKQCINGQCRWWVR